MQAVFFPSCVLSGHVCYKSILINLAHEEDCNYVRRAVLTDSCNDRTDGSISSELRSAGLFAGMGGVGILTIPEVTERLIK